MPNTKKPKTEKSTNLITLREIKKWRRYWGDKGYELVKVKLASDAKSKRSFHKNHIDRMYLLKYVSVRPKTGRKLRDDCIMVVSLGSYYPSCWGKAWFKN